MITAADIRAEHNAAILSLDRRQRRAFQRMSEMRALGPGLTGDEKLQRVCEREAAKRVNPLDVLFAPSAEAAT